MSSPPTMKVTISSLTIVKILVILLLLLFLYLIRDILILLLVSMILAAALDPWVDWLQEKAIPRGFAILLIYIIIISVISLTVVLMIPPIMEQVGEIYRQFPSFVEKISGGLTTIEGNSVEQNVQNELRSVIGNIQSSVPQVINNIFSAMVTFFGGLFGIFAVLVMTFYMVVQEDNIEKLVRAISPEKYHSYLIRLLKKISIKMGLWLRGQLLLGLIVGIMVYLGLTVLGVKYALVLGLLSAITELIPFIGPWIGAVPGVLLAFAQAPYLGLAAAIIYLVVQQMENNIIVPKLMSKVVGLSPLMVIIALLIGAKIAGVIGALIAIPVALIISVSLDELGKVPE